jgi:hypothetical protein
MFARTLNEINVVCFFMMVLTKPAGNRELSVSKFPSIKLFLTCYYHQYVTETKTTGYDILFQRNVGLPRLITILYKQIVLQLDPRKNCPSFLDRVAKNSKTL